MVAFGWCLHCERAFRVPDGMRLDDHVLWLDEDHVCECPFKDCDGHAWDLWTWEEFRRGDNSLPVVPTDGVEYPLYATHEGSAL